MTTDFYQTLGVSQNASADAIKQAYRKLVQQYHPDKNPDNTVAAEFFLKIQEAYETLADVSKKAIYDRNGSIGFYKASNVNLGHYFKVHCSATVVKLNDEFDITYSYTGEGRNFIRPSFANFFLSGKPIVSTKMIFLDGEEVKETSLIYTLAPLFKGSFTIKGADIKLHQQPFKTPAQSIYVTDNTCCFLEPRIADGKPLIFKLNYEEVITGQYIKTTRIQQHEVLIPRSKQAQYFHTFGEVLKYLFTIWIIALSVKWGYGFILGFIAGSIIGFVNAELFYKLVGVKSKVFYSPKFVTTQKYISQGYYIKNRLNNRDAFAKEIYIFESIFI